MFRVSILCSLMLYVTPVYSDDPPGHLQPLGSHKPPIKVEIRESVPDPVEFFNKYIERSKPVILRGAAKMFPNFKTWKSDDYLREKFGDWYIIVEKGKYEGSIFGKMLEMHFKTFLDSYQSEQYYMIQSLETNDLMISETSLLKAMACGGYDEHIERILLLFSSGSTQSALHWDGVDNMHCVMDGTKEWIMFDRKDIPRMTKLNVTSYAEYDCRSVDMYKYPEVQELEWYYAFLETGDCLYVPYSWPHHVKSSNRRSMALAVWFHPMAKLNMSSCPQDLSKLPDFVPVGQEDMSKVAYYRSCLITLFVNRRRDQAQNLSKKEFIELVVKNHNARVDEAETIFARVDANKNGFITIEEIASMSEEEFAQESFELFEPNEDTKGENSREEISKDEL